MVIKKFKVPLGLAGISIGASLLGSALGPSLPAGTSNPLTFIGTSSAKFAGLAGTIILTGLALKELKKIQPNKMKRRKK